MTDDNDLLYDDVDWQPLDPSEHDAREFLRKFFESHNDEVFFSRQIEVQNEARYFHWITNRAIRDLVDEGILQSESRNLRSGGSIKLIWNKSYRFYRRSAARLVRVVEEYSDPNIGAALGLQGEFIVLEAFARNQFVMKGRHVREYSGAIWSQSEHDLDFVFERDSIAYGVEVKNTLGYMDYGEFKTKVSVATHLGLRPVLAVRMIPKSWIHELNEIGGYALIMKYQLYPWSHKDLARKVAKELGLPVDAPRALEDGTMAKFLRWHGKQV